jgi:hypothetical protein
MSATAEPMRRIYDPTTGDTTTRPVRVLCGPCIDGQHYRWNACQRVIAPEPHDYPCQCADCGTTARPLQTSTN